MADTKISALTAATSLDGTEVVPVVQAGATKKAAASLVGPKELGYAEIQANFATSSTSAVDVPGLSITVVVGARPIKLIFDAAFLMHSVADKSFVAEIVEGTTLLTNLVGTSSKANGGVPVHREVRLSPTPGEHTYKVRAWSLDAGTSTINASAQSPAFLQAVEV